MNYVDLFFLGLSLDISISIILILFALVCVVYLIIKRKN